MSLEPSLPIAFLLGLVLGALLTALVMRQWWISVRDETFYSGIERGRELERLVSYKTQQPGMGKKREI